MSIHNVNNEQIQFTHLGNNRPGMLISIPVSKNYSTFDKIQRKRKWINSIIEFIIKTHLHNTPDQVSYWLLKSLEKRSHHIFMKLASELGLNIINKMSSVEAAAMWTEANVSYTSAKIIIRHLYTKFKSRVQVPFTHLTILASSFNIKPQFDSFTFKKDGEESKVGELVRYWTIDPTSILEKDFSRLLTSDPMNTFTKYGYHIHNSLSTSGCVVILGADHGAGRSRYLLRLNYLPSSSRRKMNRADFGTRTLQFAEVECSKDYCEIQAKIAPAINKTLSILSESKLIAIQLGSQVVCKLVPILATNFVLTPSNLQTKSQLSFQVAHITRSIEIDHSSINDNSPPIIWDTIPAFETVIAGDLSFFCSCTGRHGHSHCHCVYCDLSSKEWNDPIHPPGNKMTLEWLQHLASNHKSLSSIQKKKSLSDSKGVSMHPLINIDPQQYIIPILHLLIGIVNKAWRSLNSFFDEFIDNVSADELKLKEDIRSYESSIHSIEEEIELLTLQKNIANLKLSNTPSTNSSKIQSHVFALKRAIKSKVVEKSNYTQTLKNLKKN